MNRVLTSFVIVTMVRIGRNLFSEIFPVWICDWPAATKRQYCVTYIRIRMIAGTIFERFEIDRSRLDIFSYISPSCEKKKNWKSKNSVFQEHEEQCYSCTANRYTLLSIARSKVSIYHRFPPLFAINLLYRPYIYIYIYHAWQHSFKWSTFP